MEFAHTGRLDLQPRSGKCRCNNLGSLLSSWYWYCTNTHQLDLQPKVRKLTKCNNHLTHQLCLFSIKTLNDIDQMQHSSFPFRFSLYISTSSIAKVRKMWMDVTSALDHQNQHHCDHDYRWSWLQDNHHHEYDYRTITGVICAADYYQFSDLRDGALQFFPMCLKVKIC